ncbi:MAG: sensor histidine kinase [Microlunatus sp.]
MSDGYRLDPRAVSFGGWSLFYLLVTLGTVLLVLANPTGSTISTVISAVLVAVLQGLFWLLARPEQAGIRADTTRAWVFAGLAVVGFTACAILNPWSALLLFALTPQVFMLLTPRPATVVIVALNVLPLLGRLLIETHTVRQVVQDIGSTAFVITFSLFFANRILSISRQNEERRRLIEELREREAEIAALSAARGAEAERSRISRELHDTLAQGFASIITLGHAVLGELDRDPTGARRHVELITENARENLAESRRIIAALGPGRLTDASLPEAVQRTVDTWRETTGTDVRLTVDGQPVPTAPAVDVVALRLLQEGLENVRKHARASSVSVELRYSEQEQESELVVEVRDDGAGFDPAGIQAGFGLAGMRSRVGEIGGSFDLVSAPGRGTTIHAVLPVTEVAA